MSDSATEPGAAIVESCPARAAIAGNPSDGYGGAVLSIPIPACQATVTLRSAARFEIDHSPTADDTFDDWDGLLTHLERFGYRGGRELILASLRRFATHADAVPAPCSIDVRTTILRSVGLGGSSAIVIAALRAMYRFAHTPIPQPDELASLALSVERDELDITAGLQDRVVQAYAEPMLMEFGARHQRTVGGLPAGRYRRVAPAGDLSLMIAVRGEDAEPSHVVHDRLRQRFEAGEREIHRVMEALADCARRAATALEADDSAALGAAIDESFDLRVATLPVRSTQQAIVARAREAGAHANSSGSGGAVTVFVADPAQRDAVADALAADGCLVIPVVGHSGRG